jgi:D-arabinono-1,4-lactone oxidase
MTDIPHPLRVDNVGDIIPLIKTAQKKGQRIRVVGSNHSIDAAIGHKEEQTIAISLSGELRKITLLGETLDANGKKQAYVKVGGGCYLGHSPTDSTGSWENSLNYWLDQRGYAIPIMGGLSHQSIAGFLLTGSSGGSVTHGLHDFIEAIELIDGQGQLITLTKDDDDFYGVAVSMGLMGIVTAITIRAIERYYVKGREENVRLQNAWIGPSQRSTLSQTFRETEYMHLNWFAQPKLQRVMQWSGQQAAPPQKLKPYKNIVGNRFVASLASASLWLANRSLAYNAQARWAMHTVALLLKPFVILSHSPFYDIWWRALPADDFAPVNTLFKTDFTEIWLPLERAGEVVSRLEQLFKNSEIAGNFATEIYATKASPFWLSPAYQQDVIRIDPYWWAHNKGDARQFFEPFWQALLDIKGARLHWGKYLPTLNQHYQSRPFNHAFIRQAYPKFDDWLALRARLDPKQIFLSDYWRDIFAIDHATEKDPL